MTEDIEQKKRPVQTARSTVYHEISCTVVIVLVRHYSCEHLES